MARGTRKLVVELIGDSRSLERALAKSSKATQKFSQDVSGTGFARQLSSQADAVKQVTAAEEELVKVRSRKASSIGPFRLAGVGLGAGLGLFAATQAVRELSVALEETGEAAFTTQGRLKNMASALLTGNFVGAFKALAAVPKTLEEAGRTGVYSTKQFEAIRKVATGTELEIGQASKQTGLDLSQVRKEADQLRKTREQAGTANKESAKQEYELAKALRISSDATEVLNDWTARLGQTMETQSGAVVTFKGAVDDLARAGRGEAVGKLATPFRREGRPTLPPLSPSQRRELELIGKEGSERIPLLQDRLRQLNNQMKDFHGNQEQRLKILNNVANTEKEIAGIYKDQADRRKAAAEAAKRAAEAAKREAEAAKRTRDALAESIKSAVLERLQRRQTDVLNKRALQDAKERLRIARYLGGPLAIRAATRGMQDVRFDIERARLERAPVSLRPGGRFALGGVTININGATDPDAIARKVVQVLQKRDRHTGSQSRGPTAGGSGGAR